MMGRTNRALSLMCWGACSLSLIGIVSVGNASAAGFAVVVNKSINIDNISFNDLVKYFSAKKQLLPNGELVVILLREAGSEEMGVLLKKVYKLSEDELGRLWVGKVYRGYITSPPRILTSPYALIRAIRNEKGGIGIVKEADVTDDVKVLKIDGKLPSDEGNPLAK